MTGQSLIIPVPPGEWISANGRLHWAARARRTRRLRGRACWLARHHRLAPAGVQARVIATITYPRPGRADPANSAPTVKAIVDGLTDAGVWPDDDSRHVIGPDYRRGPGTTRQWADTGRDDIAQAAAQPGWHIITITIIPVTSGEEHTS